MPDYPQYVRDLVKAWAEGDDHAGHVPRFLASSPEEREIQLREAKAFNMTRLLTAPSYLGVPCFDTENDLGPK